MNKFSIKFLCIIFVLLFTLTSCITEPQNEDTETTDTIEESTIIENKLIISENLKTAYTIIIPDSFTAAEKDCANNIREVIYDKTGTDIKVQTDYIPSSKVSDDSNLYEILVGNTSRSETTQTMDEVSYSEYILKNVGTKIVLFAYSDDGIKSAVNEFINILTEAASASDTKSIIIENFTNIKKSLQNFTWLLPKYDGGKMGGLFDCGDDATMAYISRTNITEFDNYIETLKKIGYEEKTSNNIGNNKYLTLNNSKHNVFVYYTAAYSEVRIIQEKYMSYSTMTEKTGTSETALFATTANDKSPYVVRLADNSLIVFDGHVYSDTNISAQITKFYNELKEISGGDKIKISAWFISHVHADHTNMFNLLMLSPYAANIKLDRVIMNVSSIADLTAVENGSSDNYNNYIAVITNINAYSIKYGVNTQVIKAHTGQVFNFCGVVFEILYTHEDYLPRTYPIEGNFKGNGINSHSIVMRMHIGDKVVIWTGDMSNEASVIIEKTYGNQLKCDIVQVGHHGNNTSGEVSFYLKCDPQILLWTNSYDKFVSEVLAYNRSGAAVYNALKDKVSENVYLYGDTMYKIVLNSPNVNKVDLSEDTEGYQYSELHQ